MDVNKIHLGTLEIVPRSFDRVSVANPPPALVQALGHVVRYRAGTVPDCVSGERHILRISNISRGEVVSHSKIIMKL